MTPSVQRAVFLDRDGVINEAVVRDGKPFPPLSIDQFVLFEDTEQACLLLKENDFLLVVVTNQPDVGRGTQSRALVEEMHAHLCAALPIDRVEVCYDAFDGPESRRRKPKPGMLVDAAAELGIDLSRSYMVGDRWRDIDCGNAAGCTTVLIDRGYNETLRSEPTFHANDLLDAARLIIAHQEVER